MPLDHFPADLPAFLRELRENNHRDWFQANKKRFSESVQEPLLAFVEAIGPRLAKITP